MVSTSSTNDVRLDHRMAGSTQTYGAGALGLVSTGSTNERPVLDLVSTSSTNERPASR